MKRDDDRPDPNGPPTYAQIAYLRTLGEEPGGNETFRSISPKIDAAVRRAIIALCTAGPGLAVGQIWHHPRYGMVRITRVSTRTLTISLCRLDKDGQPTRASNIATLHGARLVSDSRGARAELPASYLRDDALHSGRTTARPTAGPSEAAVAAYLVGKGEGLHTWAVEHGIVFGIRPTAQQMRRMMELARAEILALRQRESHE